MNSSIRLNEIERFIQIKNQVSVSELSEKWEITEETVRRDLDKLVIKGSIKRVHGGAVWVKDSDVNKNQIDFYKRQVTNVKEKRKIAVLASDLIATKRTIFADASSTVVETLKSIKDNPGLTVVTNSCEIFKEVNSYKSNLISTGGFYNSNSQSFQGIIAKESISRYHSELTIIGSRGLDLESGATDSYESEWEIKKEMLKKSDEVALLVDYSKFDKIAFIHLTDLNKINYIITDRKPSKKWLDYCNENQIEIIY